METNWKIGDIAICVKVGSLDGSKGNFPPLRLNAEYVVQEVRVCSCGHVSLDVGLPGDRQKYRCYACGIAKEADGIHPCSSLRFVKKQSKEEIQKQISEAVAEENYELAHELSQLIRK